MNRISQTTTSPSRLYKRVELAWIWSKAWSQTQSVNAYSESEPQQRPADMLQKKKKNKCERKSLSLQKCLLGSIIVVISEQQKILVKCHKEVK